MAKSVKLDNIDKIDFIDKNHIEYMDVTITFNISDADVDAILKVRKEN